MSSKNYWNKIDLHQHTNHDIDCNGNFLKSDYTHKNYYLWLKVQKVNLKAVTCHNNIDLAEQIKQAIISDMLGINHLVGVEIDYCFNDVEFHAISILSPNVNIIKFSKILEDLRKEKNGNLIFSLEDFIKLHTDTEFIFIPHAIKQKGIFQSTSIEELDVKTVDWVAKSLISGMSEPILFENTKDYHIHSLAYKIKKTLSRPDISIEDIPVYVGTDYKFDNDAERKRKISEKPQYSILSQPTYRGLELAIRNNTTRISLDAQIIDRDKYIEEININDDDNFNKATLKLSPGLNVIIGNSGSGKTLLLNQIYYQLKKQSLKASLKSDDDNKYENSYKKRIGNKEILDIKFNKNYNTDDVIIIEIPNIYTEILRTQENGTELPEMFGINDISTANDIIINYKNEVSKYSSNLDLNKFYYQKGRTSFLNVTSAINFLAQNKLTKISFNLEIHLFNDEELNKIEQTLETINEYISKNEAVKSYFNKLKNLLLDNDKILIDKLIEDYEKIIVKLKNRKKQLNKDKQKLLLELKLTELINTNINKIINLLGNKEKIISDRKTILTRETKSISNNIKELIKNEFEQQKFNLSFPYSEIKNELEKNKNEYARISLNDDLFNIESVDITDSKLFNIQGSKTKIKGLNLNKINFNNNSEVKQLVKKLNDNEIKMSSIINEIDAIPKNVEIYLSEKKEWRLIQNTNKGDIAKKSMEFYFNKLVKSNQPNIILIDQPENDVDKTFISTTLSKFIKEQKIDKQIIITSHDAIVAINSDVNKIIEATIDEDNKFNYVSYDLEYVNEKVLEATNRVSKILDGGKENIKKRYQIYGGELNYENIYF